MTAQQDFIQNATKQETVKIKGIDTGVPVPEETTHIPAQRPSETSLTTHKALGRGFEEGFDRSELIIPRLKIIQLNSPELLEEDGLKQGSMLNSVTREVLYKPAGKDNKTTPPLVFVPIFKFTTYIRWNPKERGDRGFDPQYDAGSIIYRTNDRNDQRVKRDVQFGTNGEAPLCTQIMSFLSMIEVDGAFDPLPIIISFCNSNFKTGKALASWMMFKAKKFGGDMFDYKYSLCTELTKNAKGTFHVFKANQAGVCTNDERMMAVTMYNEYSDTEFEVHDEVSSGIEAIAETNTTQKNDNDEIPF